MGRRNYGFERRRRADAQRAKQAARRERKALRPEGGGAGPEMGQAQDSGAPEGMWEWFSPSRSRVATTSAGVRPDPDPPDDWVLLTDVEEEPGSEGNGHGASEAR